MQKKLTFLILGIALSGTVTAQHIARRFPIKSSGGWDYITLDAEGKRLFVSHGTQVNVLSLNGDSLGVITGTNGVHGIALASPFKKGYTSNGKANSCTVFNISTLQPIATIPAGTNPDAIFYDDYSKKVYAFNGKSQDASVIDPVTDKVIATIPLGGKPETGVSNGKGLILVNIETTNEVVAINANTYKVEHRYKLEGGDEPSGLAIDKTTDRLFVGCGGNATLIVMDAANGKNLAKFKIGDCDGVAFDPAIKTAYVSNREGNLSVIKELSSSSFKQLPDVTTEAGARTLGLDPVTHKVYLPTAKMENNKPVAGTFHVIEVNP